MRRTILGAAVGALLTTVGAAHAADPALGGSRDRWPSELTRRPLTLGAGMIEVWAPVQLNASKGADWKPVTSNPSLAIGITDRWEIGIRHLVGLCFGGAGNGCPKLYDDVGAFTRVSIVRVATFDVAIQGGVDLTRVREPRSWAANAGLILRAGGGVLAVTAAPTVGFGLNDRAVISSRTSAIQWNLGTYDVTTAETVSGNKEHLSVPVTLQLQLGPTLALVAGASLEGPLDPAVGSFSDFYRIPVGAAVVVTPVRYLDVGASITFPRFGGKDDTRDPRFVAAFVAFRI